jgi:hypothetical protein
MAALGYFNNSFTPDQLAQRKQELDYVASRIGGAQNVGAGVGDIFKGLAVGFGRYKAGKNQAAGNAGAQAVFDPYLRSLSQPNPQGTPPAAPNVLGGMSAPQGQGGPVARPSGTAMQGFGNGQTGQMVSQRLQKDFGLSPGAAAGFAGNLAHESGNFKTLQEINPTVAGSRGGFGWAQWTGPRRRQFESWAAQNGLDPSSPEANYGFLSNELRNTPEKAVLAKLQGVTDPAQAAQIVSQNYLRPGVPHMDSRIQYANQIAGSGQQVASNDPQQAFNVGSPQPASFQPPMQQDAQAQPQQATMQPQQVAQAQPQPQAGPSPQFQLAMKVYSNAWATPEQKQMAMMTIQQEMQNRDPMHQLQMQQAQQGVDKGSIELEQLRHPAAPKPIEVGGRLIDPVTMKPVYEPPPALNDKPPTIETLYDEKTGQAYKGQWNAKTQSWDRVGGNKADSNGITITNPDGTTTQIGGNRSGGKMTEADHKAVLLASQMVGQEKELMDGFDQLANVSSNIPSSVGGDFFKTGKAQIAEDGMKNAVANWLYITSGATAPPQEVDRQFEMVRPSIFDKPERRVAKKARLQSIFDAMKSRANMQTPAVPESGSQKPIDQMTDQELQDILNGQ